MRLFFVCWHCCSQLLLFYSIHNYQVQQLIRILLNYSLIIDKTVFHKKIVRGIYSQGLIQLTDQKVTNKDDIYTNLNPRISIISMEKDFDLVFESAKGDNTKASCGCYALNLDLMKQRPGHRVLVPLRSIEYHAEIVDTIVLMSLTQQYFNPTDKFLEVEYRFPVPPEACIYRFAATFAKTRIEGVVKEKEEARKEYEEAVKEGRKAALGQLDSESRDTLCLKVGNVPPGETVEIQIGYMQEMSLAYNTFLQLRVAGTISPRYLSHIPEKDLKAGLRSQTANTQGRFFWNFRVSLRTSRPVTLAESNTHVLEKISQEEGRRGTELRMKEACLPNRDFVFSYSTEDFQMPSIVFGRTDAGSSAVLSFVPRFCSLSLDDAYRAAIEGKKFETEMGSVQGEFVFLLDRSGSMDGQRITKAKQALTLFIRSLPSDCFFNIVSFGSNSSSLFPESVAYGDKTIQTAIKAVEKMNADMGGTQIYDPLSSLLNQKVREGYPRQVFLLTDGAVSDTKSVIRLVALSNGLTRVHTIGIGNGCSQALILGCAKKGKGQSVFITDHENPAEKIIQMLGDALSPVITGIKLDYNKSLVESVIPNPESLPCILKGELVNFYVTFKGQLDTPASFEFRYEDSHNRLPYAAKLQVDPKTAGEPLVDRMAHFRRLRLLEEALAGDSDLQVRMSYAKVVDQKAQVVRESVKHQILSEHTAFICVQKQLVDGRYEEVKDKGQIFVKVQNPLPQEYKEQQEEQYNRFRCLGRRPYELNSPPLRNINQESFDLCMALTLPQSPKCDSVKLCMAPRAQKKSAGCMGGGGGGVQKQKYSAPQPPIPQASFSLKPKKDSVIDQLISSQSADGCWKDLSLIGKILGKDVEKAIGKQAQLISVITYLLSRWIQKHYPQKQYSLVAKKGLAFVKQHVDNYQKFPELYDKYLK